MLFVEIISSAFPFGDTPKGLSNCHALRPA
jgi:hypothetical protein